MALSLSAADQGVEHVLLTLLVICYLLTHAWCKLMSGLLERFRADVTSGCRAALTERAVVGLESPLPADICGRIAIHCGHQGVGALAACCKASRGQMWESQEVWMALSTSARLVVDAMHSSYTGREARETFRRAFFRTDLVCLRSLAKAGRPHRILEEAAHVACGLLPDDLPPAHLDDFIQIASRTLGAHDPESAAAVSSAQRLLRAARRCMELFTEEQLEHLEYAYKGVHQLHALMLSSMKKSYEDILEESFWCDPTVPVTNEEREFKDFYDLRM